MSDNYSILVVNQVRFEGDNLKELIEFMDTPNVCTATPDDWREALGERMLEAVFVGPDLADDQLDGLLTEIRDYDPNVSIVIMQAGEVA